MSLKVTIKTLPTKTVGIDQLKAGEFFRKQGGGFVYMRTEYGALGLQSAVYTTVEQWRGQSLVLLYDVELTAREE